MNSGMESGTSVSPTAPLTYFRILEIRYQSKKQSWNVNNITSWNLPWPRAQNIRYAESLFERKSEDGVNPHTSSARSLKRVNQSTGKEERDIHMLEVKMSVSRPCSTSPLK